MEAFLFRTNLYRRALLPFSTTGAVEMVLDAELNRPIRHPKQVLAIGDSRMALRIWLANRMDTGYTFGFAGMAGTLPRVWFYLLRDVDTNRNKYAGILLPVDDYDDEDWEDLANRSSDLRYLIYRLRYSDLFEFAGSYTTRDQQWIAARGTLLRGLVLKEDVQEFLRGPSRRMEDVRAQVGTWYGVQQDYAGPDTKMTGLAVDWSTRKVTYPGRLTAAERKSVDEVLLRGSTQQTGARAAYMRKWFGKIVDRYEGSRTKLIFYRVPRGPLVRPANPLLRKTHSIRELAVKPNVILLDEHLFEVLEKPELFADMMHLNAEGSRRFTELLASEVGRVLGQ